MADYIPSLEPPQRRGLASDIGLLDRLFRLRERNMYAPKGSRAPGLLPDARFYADVGNELLEGAQDPNFWKGFGKEAVLGVLGIPGDIGFAAGNAPAVIDNWREGRPLMTNVGNPEDYALTTDGLAKSLGIPFEGGGREAAGRVAGGILDVGGIAKGLGWLARQTGGLPVATGPGKNQRGMAVGSIDITPIKELYHDFDTLRPEIFAGGTSGRRLAGGKTPYAINPTPDDMARLVESSPAGTKFRVIKDSDGNVYAYDSSSGIHEQFVDAMESDFNREFTWDDDFWRTVSEQEFTAPEVLKIMEDPDADPLYQASRAEGSTRWGSGAPSTEGISVTMPTSSEAMQLARMLDKSAVNRILGSDPAPLEMQEKMVAGGLGSLAKRAGLIGNQVSTDTLYKPQSISSAGPMSRQRGATDFGWGGLLAKDVKKMGFGRGAKADPGAPKGFGGGGRARASEISTSSIIDGPDWEGAERTVRDVAKELERRTLDLQGGKPLKNTEQNIPVLGARMAEEAAAELKRAGNAAEWYRTKMREMHDMAAQRFPEIATDHTAKAAFDWALAVTSNGQTVDQNVLYAVQVYNEFRKTGKFPVHADIGWGKEADKMRSAFEQWNEGVDAMGADTWVRAMDTDFTVKELAEAGIRVSGLPMSATVKGSAIAGPKIGAAFYQNIRGNRKPVTKDLWFTRMFNRLKGDAMASPEKIAGSRDRFIANRAEMKRRNVPVESGNADEAARTVNSNWAAEEYPKQTKALARGDKRTPDQLTNEELIDQYHAAARTHTANLDPRAAPANSSERMYMDKVVDAAIHNLKSRGLVDEDFQPADLQALVWFPEKVLYAKMGAKDTRAAPTDYAIEMRKLNEAEGINVPRTNRNTGRGRPRLATPVQGGNAGAGFQAGPGILSAVERDRFLGRSTPDFPIAPSPQRWAVQ